MYIIDLCFKELPCHLTALMHGLPSKLTSVLRLGEVGPGGAKRFNFIIFHNFILIKNFLDWYIVH